MQLKTKKAISSALATATCALLGDVSVVQAEDHGWEVDTAVLFYNEKDRVSAIEPVINAKKTFSGDRILNLKLVFDSLSGASPNGATATNRPQTFTRPSGETSYVTETGEIPLDDSFEDTRSAFGIGWEQPLGRLTRMNVGGYLSSEEDYSSMAVNAGISRDFNKRNTTLSAAVSYSADEWKPHGGIPIPFASMQPAGEEQPRQGETDDKTVSDLVLGVTQIINRRTLMQLNYSFSHASGYLNDPYKLISVIEAPSGETLDYIFEGRPEDRTKHSVFWKTKYHLHRGDTIDFSYRYMIDDWDINSHTFDFNYRWNIRERYYFEPHVRYYHQSAAEFYRNSVLESETTGLTEASADNRLAEFDGLTLGARFGFRFSGGSELSLRLERYTQTGDTSPSDAIGVQNTVDLFPDLEAYFVQIGYSFSW